MKTIRRLSFVAALMAIVAASLSCGQNSAATEGRVKSLVTGVNPDLGGSQANASDGVSGAPLVRRRKGLIIGVTTGVDVTPGRGLHTGLEPIYRRLEQCGSSLIDKRVAISGVDRSSRITR